MYKTLILLFLALLPFLQVAGQEQRRSQYYRYQGKIITAEDFQQYPEPVQANIIKEQQEYSKVLLLKAVEAESMAQPKAAFAYLDTALRLYPEFAEGFANTGLLLLKNGYRENAVRYLTRATQLNDSLTYAHWGLSHLYTSMEQYDKAILALNKVMEYNPSEKALQQRSDLYFAQGDYTLAIKDINQLLEQNESAADLWAQKGKILLLQEDMAGATQAYQQATTIAKDSTLYLTTLGVLLEQQKEYKQVDLLITTLEQQQASTAEAYFLYSLQKYRQRSYIEAMADVNKAISIQPKAHYYIHRSALYILRSKAESALNDTNQAIALSPKNGSAYLNKGIAEEMLQQYDKACQSWQIAAANGVSIANEYLKDCK
ncbi:tetratricopeptide repeat protein [Algivirga pacifica]|uniref:Tetratricopeptide repeat-containing protein n=1 Tax=Algivirga pacifica TaxID=1162670 RepID=A0ABP9DGF5_9BACT